MNALETRIVDLPLHLKSPGAPHAIVSMPRSAWGWLDDYVQNHFPAEGYTALMEEFQKEAACPQALSRVLKGKAQEYYESQMATLYDLSNDNAPAAPHLDIKDNPADPFAPEFSNISMPFAYQLFRFVAHATHLSTIWERRYYHLRDLADDIAPHEDD